MDDGGHRENGRHKPEMYKPAHSQWLMQQPQSMKHIMSIMAERDAAIQERNMAINEKNKVCEERDLAIMQRDAVIQERDEAIMERDNALAALQFRQISVNGNNSCPPGCQISRGVKHMHHPQQTHVGEPSYDGGDGDGNGDGPLPDELPSPPMTIENVKSRKVKRAKDPNSTSPNKKSAKTGRKVKREGEDLNKIMWNGMQDMDDGDGDGNGYKSLTGMKSESDWKSPDIGLNQVAFDETSMPPPVCSCTGVYRQCYKWGNGGWQSSCCTTTMSIYPLPAMPNKRHARVGGRKMSGSAFSKLLSRLAAEGVDLSTPVDLKDRWAKHGTNRYITIK